jgi:hypothetical protein
MTLLPYNKAANIEWPGFGSKEETS